jgi:chromosome segregation ATPase
MVEKEMDTSEATQLLTWLDEERRRDKALLAELGKGIEQHEGYLSNIGERMERLEEGLAQTDAELARMSRFEEALQKFKDEILLEVRGSEERLRREAKEGQKSLRREGQDKAKAIVRLGERIEEVLQLGQFETQQAEIKRLGKVTSALKLQTDEARQEAKTLQEKLLASTERLDRSDKAVAKLLQERDEEKVRSEGIEEKLKLLEDWAERGSQRMADLQALGERLREEQVQLVEQLRTVDDRRKKQIDTWAKEMRSWRQMAEELREKLALTDKQYRSAERMLAALDELKTQLEQHREMLEHLQHTGEERQKQQIEEWRKENEMLWLRNDERWQQLSEQNAKRDARTTLLWESQTEHLRRQVKGLARWIKEFDKRGVRSKK